jgi:hypothetical protein
MNTPVSFELAKLLKEKEYKDKNMLGTVRLSEPEFYDPNGIIHNIKDIFEEKDYKIEDCFNAPTIAEVVMWLYEKHEIWIGVICDVGNDLLFTFKIYSTKIGEERCIVNGNMYESPTEDYEAAIEYTLKNLL